MTVDIAKLYAKVKQRAERDRGTQCEELGAAAREIAKEILFKQTLATTRRFAVAERKWLRSRERELDAIAPAFADALRSGDFVCNYRTISNFNTGYDPDFGWIYLVVSPMRPGQVKIGCTTNEIRHRLLRIRRLYEPDAVLHWARWVRYPSRLEAFLHAELKCSRVAGNTTGDSTEWFVAEASDVETTVLRLLFPGKDHWTDEIVYSNDPEAVSIVG
jgi:hypothetical protein